MTALQQALSEADENYFIGISNKGIYKRACKDLEQADVSVNEEEDSAEIQISGETCLIKTPLWESSCSCPSRTVCRHMICAMLWLKNHSFSEQDTEPEEFEELTEEPIFPEMLKQELSAVTPAQLKKAMGSQFRSFLSQLEKITLEESSILSGTLPDGTAVRLLYPLQNSTCACHKKDLCMHKAAIILAWQCKEKLCSVSDFETQATMLSETENSAIQQSAEKSYRLLCDVLRWGLVRLSENMSEHLEAAAVQSHALKMADAERMLREIGGKLSDYRERRTIFRADNFMKKLCLCAEYLHDLQTKPISEEMLGQFRKNYEILPEDLTILPIGQRSVNSKEYAGEIYYFLNMDTSAEQRFLTFSDIRPVFYEHTPTRRKEMTIPWNADVPIDSLMQSKMILHHAKISEGKLSSSKDTIIVLKTIANLNCPEVQELIYTDFRKLAIDAAQEHQQQEQLYFLHPKECISSEFDTHSQRFIMKISDMQGNILTIQVRYQAETKSFIQQLETIGNLMLSHPENQYTWLCSAYFENGNLCLFPIDVYDFIDIPEQEKFSLPPVYNIQHADYAEKILDLLQEIQDYLCALLQSGLQSFSTSHASAFVQQAEQFGMLGLSELLKKFLTSAEQFRHSLQENIFQVMQNYVAIQRYIQIGLEKLDILCALEHMQPEKES